MRLKPLVPIALLLLSAVIAARPHEPTAARGPRVARAAIDTARYEVRLAYRGYTGLAGSRNCDIKVDTAGFDSLSGIVWGVEQRADPDDDVVYTGTLKRTTRIDYCQTRGRRSATDDEQVWCVATLTGAAVMDVEITVYGDPGEGAYLKARPTAAPPDSVVVKGTCTPAGMDSIRRDYPSGESGGSPDGQPINEIAPPKFVINGAAALRVAYFPPDSVQGGWGLRVVRPVRP